MPGRTIFLEFKAVPVSPRRSIRWTFLRLADYRQVLLRRRQPSFLALRPIFRRLPALYSRTVRRACCARRIMMMEAEAISKGTRVVPKTRLLSIDLRNRPEERRVGKE